MERRFYFVVGDLLAVSTAGAVAGLAACGAIGEGWNMFVAMVVGMVVGMVVATPTALAFMPFFGAMEVMLPVMLAGMLSGMWVGMAEAMTGLSGTAALGWGMLVGILALGLSQIANATLHARS